jgi:hypothetical protein
MVDFTMITVITYLYFNRLNCYKIKSECIYVQQHTFVLQVSSNLHDFDWYRFHIKVIIYQLFSIQKNEFQQIFG